MTSMGLKLNLVVRIKLKSYYTKINVTVINYIHLRSYFVVIIIYIKCNFLI